MDIYLKNQERQYEFTKHFSDNDAAIKITSTDKQDKGTVYNVSKALIIHIDEDCEGMILWWKKYSMLEGKFFTNSAHFKNYSLRYDTVGS